VIGAEDECEGEFFGGAENVHPPIPVQAVLALDHQADLNHDSLPLL
jgi:hypothetical protein